MWTNLPDWTCKYTFASSVQFSSFAQSCPTLCDPMDCRMPGLTVHHNSRSLLKLMSNESVMPSNHLILCHPLSSHLQSFPVLKGCCWITGIHQDSWPPEEKNSIRGQRRGLIAQSFCVVKFYWSIKEIEKASDIGIRKGQKSTSLLVFSWMLYSH